MTAVDLFEFVSETALEEAEMAMAVLTHRVFHSRYMCITCSWAGTGGLGARPQKDQGFTGGPWLVCHLCQKVLKNRTIVNLGQAHTSISANFPQNTTLIKISPKIALFEVPVEPYKNRTISRIALIKWRTNQGFPVLTIFSWYAQCGFGNS